MSYCFVAQLSDSPLPEYNQSTYSPNPTWRHTARKGNEQFDVIVHGASSLPSPRDGHVPLPYVIMLVASCLLVLLVVVVLTLILFSVC